MDTMDAETRAKKLRNLSMAVDRKQARSEWKQALQRGTVTLADVLEERPECLGGMRLFDLLVLVPRVGEGRVEKMNVVAMTRLQLNLARPLHKLGRMRAQQLLQLLANEWPSAELGYQERLPLEAVA